MNLLSDSVIRFGAQDRYYVKYNNSPPLLEAGLRHFRTIVYDKMKGPVLTCILRLIDDERDGTLVDRVLLQECLSLFVTVGMGSLDPYITDFEAPFLEQTKYSMLCAYFCAALDGVCGIDSLIDDTTKRKQVH